MARVSGESVPSSSPNNSSLRVLPPRAIKRARLLDTDHTKKGAASPMDSNELSMDSKEVQNFIATTGCPIYAPKRVGCENVAVLLLMPEQIDADKVCCQVPPSCPGIGHWLFVVSLDHIDPDDMPCDSLGKYQKPHSRKHYFRKTDEGLTKVVTRRPLQPHEYDYYVRGNSYNHKDEDKGKMFNKFCYLAYNNRDEMLGPYGAVRYAAQVDPSTLKLLPQGNSKKNFKPLIRTKPSAIKQAKALLLTHTPRQVMETMETAQSMLGQTDPSHMPRGIGSISSMGARVPGYVKKTKAGRPRKRKLIPSEVTLAHNEDGDDGEGNEDVEVDESRNDEGDHYSTPAPLLAPRSYARLTARSTTPSKFDALKIQVLHSERKKNDAELQKIEIEKDYLLIEKDYLLNKRENLLSERDKLDSESEFFKAGTDKLHLEMSVLKAKKIKLDMELAKMRNDEDVVVVRNDMGYRASYHQ